ncbi:MAG: glycosyltransferase [Bacteroidales bacterium]
MLSIAIPVFNTDVRKLVQDLLHQGQRISLPFEIILADDASLSKFRELNDQLKESSCVRTIRLDANIGRSAIRNLLAHEAAFPWLLFLDCDSGISDASFLAKYLSYTDAEQVVCGGRYYGNASAGNPEWKLHRKYGIKREQQPSGLRNRNPYRSFMTNNFLIPRPVFQLVGGFDEQLREYGHEDTLFGYQLQLHQVPLVHIDNPVEHLELQSNREFVQKSLQAAKNLALIDDRLKDPVFRQSVSLLRFHYKIKDCRIDGLVRFALSPLRGLLSFILTHIPSLLLLDAVKYQGFLWGQPLTRPSTEGSHH